MIIYLFFFYFHLTISFWDKELFLKPPNFPTSYESIITKLNNKTGEVYYSGRFWYDFFNKKKRLDIKPSIGEMITTLWRFDLNKKFIITKKLYNTSCIWEDLHGISIESPLNLNHSIFLGIVNIWGENCESYKVFNITQENNYFYYYITISKKYPYGTINPFTFLQTNWLFFHPGPQNSDDFEIPKNLKCLPINY
jgi:hypothetical protein